jgi:diguanylate cyclase (GGDEF)-like protein
MLIGELLFHKGGNKVLNWSIRIITFITNSLVLVGFAMLVDWLLHVKMTSKRNKRLRTSYVIVLTIAFLALFHTASILSIMQQHNYQGYGWTYINFQIGTVMYTLLSSRHRSSFYSLALVLLIWFWWLPNVPHWLPIYLITLGLMWLCQHYGERISANPFTYYSFALIFATPFLYVNIYSLHGIDVGWPFQLLTLFLTFFYLWEVHSLAKRQRAHQATLLEEAHVDELTQLNNFRVFNEDLLAAYDRMQAGDKAYALYTFDIDHFKHVNDRYGHLVGNLVLEQVAKRLTMITAQLEFPVKTYRTGGEEFSFILFNIEEDFQRASEISQMVHDELSKLVFTTDKGECFSITISLGEDRSMMEDRNYLDVYNRADKYLYSSKRNGRNIVTVRGITLGVAPHPDV